jgi:hypothetical protein
LICCLACTPTTGRIRPVLSPDEIKRMLDTLRGLCVHRSDQPVVKLVCNAASRSDSFHVDDPLLISRMREMLNRTWSGGPAIRTREDLHLLLELLNGVWWYELKCNHFDYRLGQLNLTAYFAIAIHRVMSAVRSVGFSTCPLYPAAKDGPLL